MGWNHQLDKGIVATAQMYYSHEKPLKSTAGEKEKQTTAGTEELIPEISWYTWKPIWLGGGFKYVFMFIPTWGNDAIWLIFFKSVETTN